MKVTYSECTTGRHTEVSYADAGGWPLAARFAGWLSEQQVQMKLEYLRGHDRNRVSP